MEEQTISIKQIGNILKQRLNLIIVIILITTITSIILTYFVIDPTYTTTAEVLVGKKNASESGTEYSNNDVQMYQKLMGTYAKVVKSKDVIKRAIERGNLDLDDKKILSSLSVTTNDDNQILTLSYVSKDSKEGVEVLTPLIEEFDETSKDIISTGEMFVLTSPEMPSVPTSPNKKMNIMIGIFLGTILGIIIAFFLEYVDDTIKGKEDIESLLHVSVIGSVPIYSGKWDSLDNNSIDDEKRQKHR